MLSLYVHIPFCRYKCMYCSFFVLPEEHASKELDTLKDEYLQQLLQEVTLKRQRLPQHPLKTLYIWGGTPLQLGKERLWTLLDQIFAARSTEDLEELTIELNPDPQEEVLAFVAETQARYPQLMRIRRSFGLQTFDDELLKQTKRAYTFGELTTFLRELPALKQQNTVYNLDFIAFGKTDTKEAAKQTSKNPDTPQEYKGPRTNTARVFFERMVNSYSFDGFSVYTLELFPGSDRYYQDRHMSGAQRVRGDDDHITDEANRIKDTLHEAGYGRYEVSNFALSGKRSLHNMVYRTGWTYLWLWMYASSYMNAKDAQEFVACAAENTVENAAENTVENATENPDAERTALCTALLEAGAESGIRRKHTQHRKEYLSGVTLDAASMQPMSVKEQRIEQAILGLRTDAWLKDYEQFTDLFVPNRSDILASYEEYGLIERKASTLLLTEAGRDVYNTLITDLLREV